MQQGIFAAATYIHCSTQGALREAAERFPGWPLLLTGHSLGGVRCMRCTPHARGCCMHARMLGGWVERGLLVGGLQRC